ncbi:MAG: hypothetical protein H0W73_03935 [Bacteroidetes bacterium]|nr:hypothetical protein [Bacteroidota bacterium]
MIEHTFILNKARSLNQIISESIDFLKKHYKKIYSFLALFAFAFFIPASLLSTYLFRDNYSITKFYVLIYNINEDDFYLYIISAFTYFVGISAHNLAINKSVLLINRLEFTLGNVKANLFIELWRSMKHVFATSFLYGIFLILICYVFAQLFTLGFASFSTVIGFSCAAIAALVYIALIFFIMPVISYMIVAVLFTAYRNSLSVADSIRYVRKLLKNNLKKVWLFSLSSVLINYSVIIILAGIFFIAIFYNLITSKCIKEIIVNYNSASLTSVTVFNLSITLITYGLCPFFHISCIYQFTSLEEEQKGIHLLEKINQL